MAEFSLTAERLREVLNYDPETGAFTNKLARQRIVVGAVAGTVGNHGYRQICIDQRFFLAHRLAWLYVHGCWPAGRIDHLNGDRLDNRIANIRDAPPRINSENQRHPRGGNPSGYLGVGWDIGRKKWRAQIKVKGKNHLIGRFDDPSEAHEAYLAAKRKLHAGCTI